MNSPKHISVIITEFLHTLTNTTMNQGFKTPHIKTDEKTGFKYYIDEDTGKRVRLKRGFDYDTDEEGNIFVRKPFIEFDMTQIGE